MTQITPATVAALASIVVLISFVIIGIRNYRRDSTAEGFFLANRDLDEGAIRDTFAGAAISVSTVMVFFLTIAPHFGWQILLSPATLAMGVLVFRDLIYPRLASSGLLDDGSAKSSPSKIRSLSDVVIRLYDAPRLARTITGVAAAGTLAVLVAEIMVGVSVLQQAGSHPLLALVSITTALALYAGLGGLSSVVATDRMQVRLIVAALSLVLIWTLTQLGLGVPNLLGDLLIRGWAPQLSMPAALVANIFIVNLCLLPASLRIWQVIAATRSRVEFRGALWHSTLVIVFVTVCTLLIGKAVSLLAGAPDLSIQVLLQFLEGSEGIAGFVLYPLFILALLSALASTADSALLPLAHSMFLSRNREFSPTTNLLVISSLLCFAAVCFVVVAYVLDMSVVGWILTVFSITTSIAPAIVIPLLTEKRKLTKVGDSVLSAGVMLACVFALAWSIYYSGNIAMQPWNCVIGVALSSIATLLTLRYLSNPDAHASNP